ncbi:MAG: hypothetical protein CMF45_08315 [Legionellales bacterium]|nr:hypothetical protein [Legionellales bacterium]|tara:strand:- start:194 stop:1063 length:870 start_codon:yes stop_codon:yes gene_type:complete
MSSYDYQKISINEISSYSPWPARLLSLQPFTIKEKTPSEITREFGKEKWGKLFSYFSNKSHFSLSDVESKEIDLEKKTACYDHQIGFHVTRLGNAVKRQLAIYKNILEPYASEASCLVELGAGYGSKILRLSEIESMKNLPLYAGEYTESGQELITLISKTINKPIKVGYCDFDKLHISGLDIPKNAIIFTSYSVHYVSHLQDNFVDFLCQFKPKVVIHFEPCYEYFDREVLQDLMSRRYMDINGYTRNIASCVELGCLKVGAKMRRKKMVFGSNPFLPFSVLEWIPRS